MSIPGSMLNMENIIRKVFDHTTDTLKTTAVGGPSGIIISSADDSIAIGNVAGDLMTVNPNGTIDTNIFGVTPVSGRVPVDIGGATVNITGPVTVSNEVEIKNDAGNPIPVNGTVVVTGVATLTEQQTQTTVLNSIDSKLTSPVTVSATNLDVRDLVFATDKVDASGSSVTVSNTVAVSAVSLPLPTGAATLTEQQSQTTQLTNANSSLSSIAGDASLISSDTSGILSEATNQTIVQNDILTKLNSSIAVTSTNLDIRDLAFVTDKVDASGSSVSVTNFPATQPVSANNLDIRDLVFSTDKVDVTGSTVALDPATLAALENTTVSVDNFPANQNVTVQNASLAVTQSGTWNVSNVSGTVSLPTGASTSALQSTINTSIGTVATNQLSGSQKAIVRGGAKGTTLAGDITSTNVDANRQALDVAIKEIPAVALDASTLASLETVSVNNFPSLVDVTGSDVTVSNVVDVNITGGNVTINSEVEIKNDVGNPVPVSGSVSIANFPATQPISAVSLPLPPGAATQTTLASVDTKLSTTNSTLASIDAGIPAALGQTTMAASMPVTLASNQTDVPVSLTSTTVTNTVAVSAASLPLPTGAATETTLSTLNGKIPSNLTVKAPSTAAVAADQALVVTLSPNNPVTATISNASIEISNDVGNPIPVNGTVTANLGTIAGVATETTVAAINTKLPSGLTVTSTRLLTDNSGVTQPISAISLPLPTGAATSALQSTGNTSLNSIDTKLTTYNNTISVTDISNATAVNGAVTVSTTATAINVSGTNLANRKNITIYNNSATVGNILYYGFSTGVTTSNGFPLARNTSVSFELGPNVTVYLIATSGSHNVRVVELS